MAALSPADAQRIQDEARAAGRPLMCFVTFGCTGKFIARVQGRA